MHPFDSRARNTLVGVSQSVECRLYDMTKDTKSGEGKDTSVTVWVPTGFEFTEVVSK